MPPQGHWWHANAGFYTVAKGVTLHVRLRELYYSYEVIKGFFFKAEEKVFILSQKKKKERWKYEGVKCTHTQKKHEKYSDIKNVFFSAVHYMFRFIMDTNNHWVKRLTPYCGRDSLSLFQHRFFFPVKKGSSSVSSTVNIVFFLYQERWSTCS